MSDQEERVQPAEAASELGSEDEPDYKSERFEQALFVAVALVATIAAIVLTISEVAR